MSVDAQFMYDLFSDLYYSRVFRQYNDDEVSTTESIQCLLKSFLQRKLKRTMALPKIVILSFGNIVHTALREPLLNRGYDVEVEGEYDLINGTLYCHSDAVADTHTLENKTISRMPNSPLTHHFLQDNAYNFMLDKPIGYLSYLHKPSGIIKVFPCKRSLDGFKYVCMRGVRLVHRLTSNTMPKPEPSWLCRYCEYTDICPNPRKYVSRRGGL